MHSFDAIRKWRRALMERFRTAMGQGDGYRTVFELGSVPALKRFYDEGVFLWKALYEGYYEPWHQIGAPTVADPHATRRLFRFNGARAAVAELAGLVWGERCAIRVSTRGADASLPDPLDGLVREVLRANAFSERMQEAVERGLALGGGAMKVWLDGDAVRVGLAAADQFVPLSWDEGRVREALFVSRAARPGSGYTRLEWRRLEGGSCVIRNELYRAGDGGADTLGARVPLREAFPALAEETMLPSESAFFRYWRAPSANCLDDGAPLGASVFAGAMETLRGLDICFDSFVREFRLGKKRIIVPARAVRTVVDPATGAQRRYFDPSDEVYEALAGDESSEMRISDNSVELRVEEHIAALDAFLGILCLQMGFSPSALSFDARTRSVRTATEVVSENARTFKTVRAVQNQLAPAIEGLVRDIVSLAALSSLRWQGAPVTELAAQGFDVSVVFDDGVAQDRAAAVAEGIALVDAGLLSRYSFLTDRRYGQGLTPDQARAELERIQAERAADA